MKSNRWNRSREESITEELWRISLETNEKSHFHFKNGKMLLALLTFEVIFFCRVQPFQILANMLPISTVQILSSLINTFYANEVPDASTCNMNCSRLICPCSCFFNQIICLIMMFSISLIDCKISIIVFLLHRIMHFVSL